MMLTAALLFAPTFVQCTNSPPAGYYATVDESSQAALQASLHAIIDDHTRLPYTSGSTDTWDVLESAQQDPNSSSRVLDVYRNRSFPKQGGGNSLYNREHSWPKSYGFPNDEPSNMPYTDCHMLYICDDGYNQTRSNKPFGQCSASCGELITDINSGNGGGSGSYPGESNWTSGAFTSGTFEVSTFRRGDVARSMFYAAIRYEGGQHGITGVSEPDLMLTDNIGLIGSGNTGQNESFAYMGRLSVLLDWHLQDPVDAYECRKNDIVAAFQGNRNPFVDHPEWVECAFLGNCVTAEPYCNPSVLNSSGAPATLTGSGSLTASDNDYLLTAESLPANQFGFFLCSQTAAVIGQPGGSIGVLCLGGSIGRVVGGQILNSGPLGAFSIDANIAALPIPTGPVAAQAGETWHFQAWFRDIENGQATSNFTDGWRVTWQ